MAGLNFGFLCAGVLVLGGWLIMPHIRRKELQLVRSRDELSDTVIYDTFYRTTGLPEASVRDAWHDIAQSLKLSAGQIRPEDRFGKDIGRWLITSDHLDMLFERGKRRAKQLGLSPQFETITTVDQYIRTFAISPGRMKP
jgi:hypothetical protein